MELNQITDRIISFAISVHKVLGPGLLESAYKQCLFYELSQLDIIVEKEGDYKLGLILNFKVMLLKDGITRIIN